jgi:putative NADH-flavin reductase
MLLASLSWSASAAPALKMVVYGGSGAIGQRIVREALSRGHIVTVVVRDPASVTTTNPRLHVMKGDVLDGAQMRGIIAGQDVVVCAVSFRKPKPDYGGYRRAAQTFVQELRSLGTAAPRLIVVGGAGSLQGADGRPVYESIPAAYRGEVLGQKDAYDYYHTVHDVAWTYFSPANTIAPGRRTGKFRLGTDRLVVDAHGVSRISMEDYAVALVDEAEKPAHIRQRFTIGY